MKHKKCRNCIVASPAQGLLVLMLLWESLKHCHYRAWPCDVSERNPVDNHFNVLGF